MAKLTKKEKSSLARQVRELVGPKDRGPIWTGIRPATFKSKKFDKKARRAETRKICSTAY